MAPNDGDDELIKSLEEAERARRGRNLLWGAVAAALVIAAFGLSIAFSDQLFRPEINIEEGEEEVIASTNDPQCRGFIADVTRIGGDYTTLEPELSPGLLGDDATKIRAQVEELERLKSELKAAREESEQANLRFDNSRQEVNDWFRYIDNELTLLQKVGREKLAELEAPEDLPDAGTLVEDSTEKSKSDKTPKERVDGATLAANEAFQKFRVWHTGGLHPCGEADEGETPWAPEGKE